MLHNKQRIIGWIALVLLLSGVFSAPAPLHAAEPMWSSVAGIATTDDLNGVFLVDPSTAWTVGTHRQQDATQGVVYGLTLEQGRWKPRFETYAPAPLFAVVAVSRGNIWAVGDSGLVMHKNAQGWQQVETSLPTTIMLRTLQMLGDGREGWAGGFIQDSANVLRPVLVHYQNGTWSIDQILAGQGQITHLHLGPDGGWAVGTREGAGLILHYAGGSWQDESPPPPCQEPGVRGCSRRFLGVRAMSSDQAWVVGETSVNCAVCPTLPILLQRQGGAWDSTSRVTGPAGAFYSTLQGISFHDGTGLAVGHTREYVGESIVVKPELLRFTGGTWQRDQVPSIAGQRIASAVSQIAADKALVVGNSGLIFSFGYGAQLPTTGVDNPQNPQILFFLEVRHTLRPPFRNYWERNGGLPVFGFPLTEVFDEVNPDTGRMYRVQYLERQRYEEHPENQGTPYEVLLGRLGDEILRQQGREWQNFPKADPRTAHYYPTTGHAIAPQFWDYWRSHGLDLGDPGVSERESLALFGLPLSEPLMETNTSGHTVLTQWFERARFEYHPANPPASRVLLGRLAAEVIAARGW